MRAFALAFAAFASTAFAAATGPVPTPPEARWFTLGTLKLASLHDADFRAANDGKTFGLGASPEAVGKLLAAHGLPTDAVPLSVNALLVRMPGHIVLIDTGLGPKLHGNMLASLEKAGVKPEQVTDILITHSHGDHVGGLVTADGKLAFPNAKIRMSAREWQWMQGREGAKDLVAAIRPHVQPFEPGKPVLPGITPVAIPGHTPGHVGYEIASGNANLLDIGDTAHSSIASLAEPDWGISFDNDQQQGKASRRAMLTKLARSHELIFAPHFPFPGVGQIVASGTGFRWEPAKLPK